MVIEQIIQIAKDILVAIAALVTGVIAIMGLRTWRKELKGKTEYNAAIQLMRSIYQLRDAIQHVRHPFMSPGEFPRGDETPDPSLPENEIRLINISYAYKNRWERVKEAGSDLDIGMLNAEAIWGEIVKKSAKDLFRCVSRLNACINLHLQSYRDPDFFGSLSPDVKNENRQILYGFGEDIEDDKFYAELLDAIQIMERLISPYLGR